MYTNKITCVERPSFSLTTKFRYRYGFDEMVIEMPLVMVEYQSMSV